MYQRESLTVRANLLTDREQGEFASEDVDIGVVQAVGQ